MWMDIWMDVFDGAFNSIFLIKFAPWRSFGARLRVGYGQVKCHEVSLGLVLSLENILKQKIWHPNIYTPLGQALRLCSSESEYLKNWKNLCFVCEPQVENFAVLYYYIFRPNSNPSFYWTNIYGSDLFWDRNWHQIKSKIWSKTGWELTRMTYWCHILYSTPTTQLQLEKRQFREIWMVAFSQLNSVVNAD